MARANTRHLKNMKTGVIFPFSQLLHENRPDLLECDEHGNPTHQAASEVNAPFLLNPVTGKLVSYSPQMGSRLGWIPVQSADHAEQVMADLGGSEANVRPQGLQPPAQDAGETQDKQAATQQDEGEEQDESASQTEETPPAKVDQGDIELAERLENADISKMNRKQLGSLVKELDEELETETGDLTLIREQVQVLVNNKLQSLNQAA